MTNTLIINPFTLPLSVSAPSSCLVCYIFGRSLMLMEQWNSSQCRLET